MKGVGAYYTFSHLQGRSRKWNPAWRRTIRRPLKRWSGSSRGFCACR